MPNRDFTPSVMGSTTWPFSHDPMSFMIAQAPHSTNLARSLLSGAGSIMKDLGSWLKGHVDAPITLGVTSLFGIHSPSTVFMGIGRNLIAGLKSGIAGAVKGIGGWIVDRIVSFVRSPFAHAGSWLPGRGSAMVSGFKSGASSVG